jgi:hypothetical protein
MLCNMILYSLKIAAGGEKCLQAKVPGTSPDFIVAGNISLAEILKTWLIRR